MPPRRSSSRPRRAGSHFSGRVSKNVGRSHFSSPVVAPIRTPVRRSALIRSPRIYVFNGRKYTYSTGTNNRIRTINILIIIALIMTAIFVSSHFANDNDLKTIERDRAHYLSMIEIAESTPGLIQTATVTGYDTIGAGGKYFIYYTVYNDFNHAIYEGESYSVYTLDEVQSLLHNEIEVAFESQLITRNTDSIPVDYKDKALEDDGEYINAGENKRTFMWLSIVAGVTCGALIIVNIIIKVEDREYVEDTSSGPSNASVSAQNKPKINKCEYCGTILGVNETSCPNCGAHKS